MKSSIVAMGVIIFQMATADRIPYDWANQFGVIDYKNSILWNRDWRSNGLSFDGTWIIYPNMLGNDIKEGFEKENNEENKHENALTTRSYFNYDQGDYLLDRFTFGLTKNFDKKSVAIGGFKRTFSGDYDQYNNYSSQPIQQSYFFNYLSKDVKDLSKFSLGHFNTYAGFPDVEQNGLYDSRITNSNFTWERKFGYMDGLISFDNFLQKFKVRHSKSIFEGPRYLIRGSYKVEFSFLSSEDKITKINIISNFRNITVDTLITQRWSIFNVEHKNSWSRVSFGFFQEDENFHNNFGLRLKKKLESLSAYFQFQSERVNAHPYFIIVKKDNTPSSYNNNCVSSTLAINKQHIDGELTLFYNKDDANYWKRIFSESSNFTLAHKGIKLILNSSISDNFNLKLSYKMQDPLSLRSSGYGTILSLKAEGNFKLFQDHMILELTVDYNRLNRRKSGYFIDPIEKIPMFSEGRAEMASFKNIFNAGIAAYVNSLSFSFEWYNVYDIILNELDSEKDHRFFTHPALPSLGGQIIFKIGWEFYD